MSGAVLHTRRRELAHRVSGGTEFTLFWIADDDSTSLEIRQAEAQVVLEFAVPRERALDAFYHPFAHLGRMRDADGR